MTVIKKVVVLILVLFAFAVLSGVTGSTVSASDNTDNSVVDNIPDSNTEININIRTDENIDARVWLDAENNIRCWIDGVEIKVKINNIEGALNYIFNNYATNSRVSSLGNYAEGIAKLAKKNNYSIRVLDNRISLVYEDLDNKIRDLNKGFSEYVEKRSDWSNRVENALAEHDTVLSIHDNRIFQNREMLEDIRSDFENFIENSYNVFTAWTENRINVLYSRTQQNRDEIVSIWESHRQLRERYRKTKKVVRTHIVYFEENFKPYVWGLEDRIGTLEKDLSDLAEKHRVLSEKHRILKKDYTEFSERTEQWNRTQRDRITENKDDMKLNRWALLILTGTVSALLVVAYNYIRLMRKREARMEEQIEELEEENEG